MLKALSSNDFRDYIYTFTDPYIYVYRPIYIRLPTHIYTFTDHIYTNKLMLYIYINLFVCLYNIQGKYMSLGVPTK